MNANTVTQQQKFWVQIRWPARSFLCGFCHVLSVPVFTPDVMALGHFRLIGGSKLAVCVSMKANGCLSLCCLCDGRPNGSPFAPWRTWMMILSLKEWIKLHFLECKFSWSPGPSLGTGQYLFLWFPPKLGHDIKCHCPHRSEIDPYQILTCSKC